MISGILLLSILPILVGFNFFGSADKLAGIPGIRQGGGLVSAASSFIIVAAGIVVIFFGAIIFDIQHSTNPATNEGLQNTSISTPIATKTPMTSQTPTVTTSKNTAPESDLEAFEEKYRTRLRTTIRNESLTGIPVIGSGYQELKGGVDELWIIYWKCDKHRQFVSQRITIGNDLVKITGEHTGNRPQRVRMYGVTNLENFNDTISYINTSRANAAFHREVSLTNYTARWWERQRIPTPAENQTAFSIATNDSGMDLVNEAFFNDTRQIHGCHGPAKQVAD